MKFPAYTAAVSSRAEREAGYRSVNETHRNLIVEIRARAGRRLQESRDLMSFSRDLIFTAGLCVASACRQADRSRVAWQGRRVPNAEESE